MVELCGVLAQILVGKQNISVLIRTAWEICVDELGQRKVFWTSKALRYPFA